MNKNDVYPLFQQAAELHRAGRLDDAALLYQQVIEALPKAAEPHKMLGILRMQQGRREEGLETIVAAARLAPNNPEIVEIYARALGDMGRFEEAVVAIEHLLAIKPDFPGAGDARAQLQQQVALPDPALQPAAFEALFRRSLLDFNMGHQLEALIGATRALALKPDAVDCWNIRGSVLRRLNRKTEALASFDRALAINPDHPAVLSNRGNLFVDDLGGLEKALADFDRALASPVAFPEGWYNRGNALRHMGRLEEALASHEKALELNPDFTDALRARAQLLLELHRTDEGLAIYRQVSTNFEEESDDEGLPHKARHDQEQMEWRQRVGVIPAGERLAGPAVNPGNRQWAEIGAQWDRLTPQVAVIDNLLTPEALAALRRFCMQEPMWLQAHHAGYLNAFPEHGFACPLIGQIADEMRATFPEILKDYGLIYFWGVKYDAKLPGIDIHGDQAEVNINFWITPDDSNLDPEGGGLIVWDKAAPIDWNFNKFNNDKGAIRDFLASLGAKSERVPYRQNRAVIFDSDLFHETDALNFKEGYENRRINITMLFGRRRYSPSAKASI